MADIDRPTPPQQGPRPSPDRESPYRPAESHAEPERLLQELYQREQSRIRRWARDRDLAPPDSWARWPINRSLPGQSPPRTR